MAHNTASLKSNRKAPKYTSRGKSRGTPYLCIGCQGKKKPSELFCKACRTAYRAAKKREQELDEMFENAIAF